MCLPTSKLHRAHTYRTMSLFSVRPAMNDVSCLTRYRPTSWRHVANGNACQHQQQQATVARDIGDVYRPVVVVVFIY